MFRKKAEDIEGVSNASFVDLKAVVYKREQDLKRHVPGDKAFSKRVVKRRRTAEQEEDLYQGSSKRQNRGIEERMKRDQESWDSERELTDDERIAKLQEKARAYQQFLKQNRYEYDDNSLIDFERKRWDAESYPEESSEVNANEMENLHFLATFSKSVESKGIEYSRDALEKYTPGGQQYEEARKARVSAILQLSQETSQNRQKKLSIKQKREYEKEKRLERIRAQSKKQTKEKTAN